MFRCAIRATRILQSPNNCPTVRAHHSKAVGRLYSARRLCSSYRRMAWTYSHEGGPRRYPVAIAARPSRHKPQYSSFPFVMCICSGPKVDGKIRGGHCSLKPTGLSGLTPQTPKRVKIHPRSKGKGYVLVNNFGRFLFACSCTAAVAIMAYYGIRWLAH